MSKRVNALLVEAGFNQLEASVYVALMKESSATGYRVSQVVGKPVANTYKALDSLVQKGAAIVDGSGRGKVYMAVPVGEYLERMKQDIEAKRVVLEKEMADMGGTRVEQGLYKMASAEQVYARARKMLAEAQSVALVDIWPAPLESLRPDLEKAAQRGVKVFIKAYAPVAVEGCEVLAPPKETGHTKVWKGDWLILITDCHEFLLSLLEKTGSGVMEALWSSNDYLAVLIYNWILQEFTLTRLGDLVWKNATKDEVVAEARRIDRCYLAESPIAKVAAPWAELGRMMRSATDKDGKSPAGKDECRPGATKQEEK
jgi:HTH-type transcriptional regulator, sugar sensing transcriptional regulator